MVAQAQFLGLFGNHTLEERVMRLMDTTTMSVRTKAVRVVSGAAMMIATGAIAGLFHVTPTMAQANVPLQATQNSPSEAQVPVPAPTASSPSVAAPPDTAHATPKKRTYVHRKEGDGESRESTLTEQPLIDKDVQQRTDDLWSQMAEDMAKANTADFKQRMEDAQQQIADAMTKFNNTESKRRIDDLRGELADDMAKRNTPELKQRMEDAQRQMAEATAKFNSPEFKQPMEDLRSRMAEDMAKANTPEFQKRMEDAQRQMADAAAKFNSLEFRQKMDDLQQQLEQQMSPNELLEANSVYEGLVQTRLRDGAYYSSGDPLSEPSAAELKSMPDDDPYIAFALEQFGAAMPASVGEGTNSAVLVTQNDQGNADERQREVITRLGDLIDRAGKIPDLLPDTFDLALIEIRRRIAPRRHSLRLKQGLANTGIMPWIEHIGLRDHLIFLHLTTTRIA